MKVRARRFGRLRLRDRNSLARRALAAELPRILTAARNSPSGQAFSRTVTSLPSAATTVSAATIQRLAHAPDVLGRAWVQAMTAASLHLSYGLALAYDALKRCWLQMQPAVGRAQPLAARLGALIGVR